MLNRSIKLAYICIALLSSTVGFLVLQNFDEQIVMGATTTIRINESDERTSASEVTSMIESFARERGVNVGRQVADLSSPNTTRQLYLTVGDPTAESAAWLDDGYPGFSRAVTTEVHPLSDIRNRDPRDYYLVFGPESAADELQERFATLGLRGFQYPFLSPSRALELFGYGSLLLCVVVFAVVVVAVVASGVLLGTRMYGVKRLHGLSFGQILGYDLLQVMRYVIGVVAAVGAAAAILLLLYNGLSNVGRFAAVAAGFFLFFAVLALLTHILVLGVVHCASILESVRGKVAAGSVISGAYLIRVPALFLGLAAATAVLGGVERVASQQAQFATWNRTGDAAYILLNGSLRGRSEEMVEAVGGWVRRASAEGEVILSVRQPYDAVLGSPIGSARPEVLIVNAAYLREHPVLDATERRLVGPADVDRVQVVMPERYRGDAPRISADARAWVDFQVRNRAGAPPDVEMMFSASGQSPFTYDASAGVDSPVRPDAPVIVVVADGSTVLADEEYGAYATQNAVVFRNADYAVGALAPEGLEKYVLAVSPVAQHAAVDYRDAVRDLRLRVFNLVAALAVLLITAVSVALVYGRKNADALFVKFISGWSFARAYRPLLVAELLVTLLLVAWAVAAGPARTPGQPVQTGGIGWEPVIAVAVGLGGGAFVVLSLMRFNRRMIVEHRSEA